jgi:integrase
MTQAKIIKNPLIRKKEDKAGKRDRLNAGKKGRVYTRGGKLWLDFQYLGERVREPSGLKDTTANRTALRRQLDLVVAEIENGLFEFATRFPNSKRKEHFGMLEGRNLARGPEEIVFGDYARRWWHQMRPGMSESQSRDYESMLRVHLLPYFRGVRFSEMRRVLVKKFVAQLKGKKNRYGKPLSDKRIQNVLIPLRAVVRDAVDEYGWTQLADPFVGLNLPGSGDFRIQPFTFEEWATLMRFMPAWYVGYFEFAVQTGLRPSEQVALKWAAVDSRYIHVELSRVRNREKTELKTPKSKRSIELRPSMQETLRRQREASQRHRSPYVFQNTHGRPILQDKLRELWMRVMKKSGLNYRRMYETRHTFASWALAAGESPEWVARTLGHVNTAMVYRTYSRYIPNLTRQDGSAFERQYAGATKEKRQPE